MNRAALEFAVWLVRAWTRLYTLGLPPAQRAARHGEIDSDLWELEHDPDTGSGLRAATHVLARLVIGVPDDVAWRVDAATAARHAPVTARAVLEGTTESRRVSALGISATVHAVAIAAAIAVSSRASLPAPTPMAASEERASDEQRGEPRGFAASQTVAQAPRRAAVMTIAAESNTPLGQRVIAAVRAAAAGAAARVGLVESPFDVAPVPVARHELEAAHVQAAPAPASFRSTASDPLVAAVLQNRYSLSLLGGRLSGSGAAVLASAVAESRFVLLGEDHGLAQTPQLAAAICEGGAPRFTSVAIEDGAAAADTLEQFARQPDAAGQLSAFKHKHPLALGAISHEEIEMLQGCRRAANGAFDVWGVSHDGFGADGLILRQILATPLGAAAQAAVRELSQKSDAANRKAFQTGSLADLFMLSADDRDLAVANDALAREGNADARALFASLVESHQIHRASPADYDNARRRERLMKRRFASEYERTKTSTPGGAVLLKLGAFHVYRGMNPARGRGIGNYVAEIADAQGAQSLHVRVIAVKGSQPIFPKAGQPPQFRAFDLDTDPRGQSLQPFLSSRLSSDWTLYDLRPLRREFNTLAATRHAELATLIHGLDMLVVVPEGTPAREIR